MNNTFKVDIISPEKIIFSDEVKNVVLPAQEGDMGLLKDHISLITFLRPGIIKLQNNQDHNEEYFIEDGIVEFFNNKLIILSTYAKKIEDLKKDFIDNLVKQTQKKLNSDTISDQEKYILNHKLEVINSLNI